jgi:hypothetical protein
VKTLSSNVFYLIWWAAGIRMVIVILVNIAHVILTHSLTGLSLSGPMYHHNQWHFHFKGSVSRENILSLTLNSNRNGGQVAQTRTVTHLILVNEGACFQFILDGSCYFSIIFTLQVLLFDPHSFVYSFHGSFYVSIFIL